MSLLSYVVCVQHESVCITIILLKVQHIFWSFHSVEIFIPTVVKLCCTFNPDSTPLHYLVFIHTSPCSSAESGNFEQANTDFNDGKLLSISLTKYNIRGVASAI